MQEVDNVIVRVGATKNVLKALGYSLMVEAVKLVIEILSDENLDTTQLKEELAEIDDGICFLLTAPTAGVMEIILGLDGEQLELSDGTPDYSVVFRWFEL